MKKELSFTGIREDISKKEAFQGVRGPDRDSLPGAGADGNLQEVSQSRHHLNQTKIQQGGPSGDL